MFRPVRLVYTSQETPEPAPTEPAPITSVVIWVDDGPVCVNVTDSPGREPQNICRCGGCRAAVVSAPWGA